MIYIDGNENDSDPSNGLGGDYPGSLTRTINVDNTYYYYLPTGYQPDVAMPLMVVWHGAAGAGNASAAAQQILNVWINEAESSGFIVVAQAATGATGGWIPNTDAARLANIIDDIDARYNIEKTRKYIWGFSAGGFVAHAIALNNADYFAAYAVSGAHLGYAAGAGYTPASASRNLPVYISVGTTDSHYVPAQNDLALYTQANWVLGKDLWFDDFVGGHTVPIDLSVKAWDKICISTNLD